FFSSRRRHTRFSRDWSSDVCSSDLLKGLNMPVFATTGNHDYESAGYIELEEVRQVLRDNGVEVLDDLKTEIEIKGKKLKIYGLKIGRASCRERVEISMVVAIVRRKR